MIRKPLFFALFVAALAFLATPSFAADANFQGNCTYVDPDSFYCEFDAERTPMGQTPTSCGLAFPVRYFWRFGDGTGDVTTEPNTDHVYFFSGPPSVFQPGIYEACVSVECSDGETAYQCHCVNLTGNQGPPPDCVEPGDWSPR